MTVDIGSTRKVSSVQIDWEFPAKAYTLSVSVDGVKWSEVHSTDSNVLHSNHIALGAVPASKVRLIMHQVWRHWGLCRRRGIEFPCPFGWPHCAGFRQLPWACFGWNPKVFGASAPPAEHRGGLHGGGQEQRCARQVLRNIRRRICFVLEQDLAQRAALPRGGRLPHHFATFARHISGLAP